LSTPFHLLLPRQLYNVMVDQAKAELPNECCGMLAGLWPAQGEPAVAAQIYPLVNAAQSPFEYLSDAHSMFLAEKARREAALEFLAIYHSHPSSAAVPSKKDLERSYSKDVINFIISLKDDVPVMQGWWLTATEFRPAEWEITEPPLAV
jgi:[CysO sulfur-carrier protein]-S-L-cysteine hydrolase